MAQYVITKVFLTGDAAVIDRTLATNASTARDALLRYLLLDDDELREIGTKPWMDVSPNEQKIYRAGREQYEGRMRDWSCVDAGDNTAVYIAPDGTALVCTYDEEA